MKEKLNGKRVLLVDDDSRNIFAMTSYLESFGIEIVPAENGRRALEILSADPGNIAIILMDMMMPVMDGFEAIARIRENQDLRDIPIISVTARAMKGDREKCLEAGATGYIAKPVILSELIAKMKEVLN